MKRMIVNKYGGPENLMLETMEAPITLPNYVRIKVSNIGVNFADTLVIRGRYQERPRPPFSPGLEISGEITALGRNVSEHKIGDLVMSIMKYGGYQSEIVVPSENTYKIWLHTTSIAERIDIKNQKILELFFDQS